MTPYQLAAQRLTGYSWIDCEPWIPAREAKALAARRSRGREESSTSIPDEEFQATHPPTGRSLATRFFGATSIAIEEAVPFAESWNKPDGDKIGELLRSVAVRCIINADLILAMASRETGLTRRRLGREFDRMTQTLDMFAAMADDADWKRPAIDTHASKAIGPAHDVRRCLVPLGPIAVFGASNFPLAYGVLGGDTASALAAGCPVIVKGHPLHPGTGELLAQMMVESMLDVLGNNHCDHFAFLQAGGAESASIGRALVENWQLAGVGFTGSRAAGEALVSVANSRRRPIPVFAEMGSSNLVFIYPEAGRLHAEKIADELAASILDSAGQQCTCPGQIFVPAGDAYDRFMTRLRDRFGRWRPRAMLGAGVARNYENGVLSAERGAPAWRPNDTTTSLLPGTLRAVPTILEIDASDWERAPVHDEIFGPAVVVVRYTLREHGCAPLGDTLWFSDPTLAVALYMVSEDLSAPHSWQWCHYRDSLARFTGRLVFNGPPTGVRVAAGMVHGGPFPATNRPDTTAVGPFAIERWCRPVCYQNCPDALLPPELQNANPRGILRLVNGQYTRDPIQV